MNAGDQVTDSGTAATTPQVKRTKYPSQHMDFSLFFWSTASEEQTEDAFQYRLLMEASKYADQNGFTAIWTPERHFHAFGGMYPNPALTGAMLAGVTERVRIRSGSCVLPLHHPVTVAEDWAVLDNMTRGRVDLGVAAGWQPNDFILNPDNHANRKDVLFDYVDQVQRLWRGDTLEYPGPDGEGYGVRTLPRPVQDDLSVWVTIAGNPETFEMAGRQGANVLTHLLGQSVEQVAEKLEIYRRAWRESGHEGDGVVTVMLHTFIGEDEDAARDAARQPLKDYLTSAAGLVKQAAWHFPTFKTMSEQSGESLDELFDNISPEDLDAVLEFAFQRYSERSGLIGTPDRCVEMVDRLKEIGVNEVGCLIDYGIPCDTVLDQLPLLNAVREACRGVVDSGEALGRVGERTAQQVAPTHGVDKRRAAPSLTPPANALEEAIVELWKQVLDIDEVGVEENFFDVGGHSLLMVQLVTPLRDHTGTEVPMMDLFRFPTIRSLARHLSDPEGDADSEADVAAGRAAARRKARQRRRPVRG